MKLSLHIPGRGESSDPRALGGGSSQAAAEAEVYSIFWILLLALVFADFEKCLSASNIPFRLQALE